MRFSRFSLGMVCLAGSLVALSTAASAQSWLVDVCSGLSVKLPVLQPVAGAASGLLAGALDPILNGVIGDVNLNLRDVLSGKSVGVSVVDQNGNAVTTPGNCALKSDGLTVSTNSGIAVGGGEISGLGSTTNAKASASDPNAIAFGNGATANAGSSAAIAIGLRGVVSGVDGIAIGRDATVIGTGGVGIGAGTAASGAGSTAIGTQSIASGNGSTALGAGANAAGAGSIALGQNTSAQHAGSVAIGSGATTSRANQIAVGTAANTYTLPGLMSAASKAAQTGPTQVVTTDAAGNLSSTPIDLRGIDSQVSTLSSKLDALSTFARETRRESRQGVASAMSMSAAAMPSAPGKTSWSGNTAIYKGEWAAGFSVAHRLNIGIPLALNAGFSMNTASFGGARFGLSGEF